MQYLPSDEVIRAAQDQTGEDDVDHVIFKKYSGRNMYGATCLGFIVDRPAEATMILVRVFHREIADEDFEGIDEMLKAERTDNFGVQTIVYYPGFGLADPAVIKGYND